MALTDAKLTRIHRFGAVQRVMGILLMIFSMTMLPPIAVSWLYGDGMTQAFVFGLVITFFFGTMVWWPVRRSRAELKIRDGFLVTVLFWAVLGLSGAIPLYLAEVPDLTLPQAVFEAISGLTTTGATVIVGLDELPRRCSIIASSCSGSAAWGWSFWRLPSCRCWGSVACSSTAPSRWVR